MPTGKNRENNRFTRWIPEILRDVKLIGLISSFWALITIVYAGLHALIFTNGVVYRWLFVVFGGTFLLFLVIGLIFEAPMRTKLRKEFIDRFELEFPKPRFPAKMLKSGRISSVLSEAAHSVATQLHLLDAPQNGGLLLSLSASDGELLAASVPNDSSCFKICQRISAVAASISLEYIAIEKLERSEFRSFTFSTDVRVVKCSRIFKKSDSSFVFLVISVPVTCGLDEMAVLGLIRALSDRLELDLLPSISPVLESMVTSSRLD